MLTLLNRALRFLGLMRVKRAERMFIELSNLYEQQIVKWVQEDFGIPPALNHEEKMREWAATAWKQAMADNLDHDWYTLEQ
jgi:hypothetical protein